MIRLAPSQTTAPDGGDPVVALAAVKSHLRVDHDNDDGYIAGLVAAAVSHLDGRSGILGRCLVTQSWQMSVGGWPCSRMIDLPFPNCSNVVIKYSDDADAEQTVDSALYQVVEDVRRTIIVTRNAFWAPSLFDDRVDPVRITFDAGYGAAAAVPQGIKHAIFLAVGHWYENREQVVVGQVDVETLPMGFNALVAPYRRGSFG